MIFSYRQPASMWAVFLAALATFPTAAATAQTTSADCTTERAVYTLQSDEGTFRVSLIPSRNFASAASDLYLRLTTPQRAYWFSFSSSQGYGGITLLPVSNPYAADAEESGARSLLIEPIGPEDEDEQIQLLSTLRFMALNSQLDIDVDPPVSGATAPVYLMMPEIGLTLWYAPTDLSEDESAERDPMPRGVFRLTACLEEAPPKAWP